VGVDVDVINQDDDADGNKRASYMYEDDAESGMDAPAITPDWLGSHELSIDTQSAPFGHAAAAFPAAAPAPAAASTRNTGGGGDNGDSGSGRGGGGGGGALSDTALAAAATSRHAAAQRHKLMLEERLKELVTPGKVLSYYNIPRGLRVTHLGASVGMGMIAGSSAKFQATVWKYAEYFNLSLGNVSVTTHDRDGDEDRDEGFNVNVPTASGSERSGVLAANGGSGGGEGDRGGRLAGGSGDSGAGSSSPGGSGDDVPLETTKVQAGVPASWSVAGLVSNTVNAAVDAADVVAQGAGVEVEHGDTRVTSSVGGGGGGLSLASRYQVSTTEPISGGDGGGGSGGDGSVGGGGGSGMRGGGGAGGAPRNDAGTPSPAASSGGSSSLGSTSSKGVPNGSSVSSNNMHHVGRSLDDASSGGRSLDDGRHVSVAQPTNGRQRGDQSQTRAEMHLGVQAVTSVAQGAAVEIPLASSRQNYGWEALDVLLDIASSPTPQSVLTLSVGGVEKMPEDRDDTTTGDANISVTIESLTRATATGSSAGASSDPSYVRHSNAWDILERMDTELAKLGLRGVTVVAASGDNGPFSYGIPNPYAAWAVKDAPCGFGPSFPGSMPHVTAVRGPEP
jgi:hypothetical protein